jgi:hypothetical protein
MFGVALVLALLGAAFLGWSIWQHREARDDLSAVRTQLAHRRENTSADAQALQREQARVDGVRTQLAALGDGAAKLSELDQQDLDAVRAAVQAGLAGDLAAYNKAVDQRTGLDPEHDTLVDQLRQQANAVITALS